MTNYILTSVLMLTVFQTCLGEQKEYYELRVSSLGSTVPTIESRIVGGTETSIEKYNFTVQILRGGSLTCGGTLLSARHVMSAAHCYNDRPPSEFQVRVGSADLSTGGAVHAVSTIINHERYNTVTADSDISLLVLATAVTHRSAGVASVPMQGTVIPDNSTVTLLGWGTTSFNGQISTRLREVTVFTINRTVCAAAYLPIGHVVTNNMICAGVYGVGGKDACSGDSGGPMVYNGVVVGVISWGEGCAERRYPGVQVRVANYVNWINQTMVRYNSSTVTRSQISVYFITMFLLIKTVFDYVF